MCYQGVLSRFFPSHFAPCSFSLHHVAFDTPVKANFTYVQPRNSPRAIHLPSASPYGTFSQKTHKKLSGFPDRKQSLLRYDAVVVVVAIVAIVVTAVGDKVDVQL